MCDCEDIHLETNIGLLQPDQADAVLAALLDQAGYDSLLLRKAVPKPADVVDPRYPEVMALVRQARRDWERWGEQLVAAVRDLLDDGKLLPLQPETEAVLFELFRDHEVAIVYRMTGTGIPSRETMNRLMRGGLISETRAPSLVEASYRLGRGLNQLEAHRVAPDQSPSLESIIERAVAIPLDEQDRQAMHYAQRRAAVYMRRPAGVATQDMERVLTEAENAALRGATSRAVEKRWGDRKFAQQLAGSLKGHPTLVNDLRRVARTELAFAHSHGAYQALKRQAAEAGMSDPEVYKLVNPRACSECRRIWGPPADPNHFKLSEIEAREATGGNFRLPRAQWGPVIGPVHPNCTEGPILLYSKKLVETSNALMEDLDRMFPRR
jgi:hypothetical protein